MLCAAISDCDITEDIQFEKFLELMTWLRHRRVTLYKQTQGFTDTEIEALTESFNIADRDGGGTLDVQELLAALKQWSSSTDIAANRRLMFAHLSQPKTKEEQQVFQELSAR